VSIRQILVTQRVLCITLIEDGLSPYLKQWTCFFGWPS